MANNQTTESDEQSDEAIAAAVQAGATEAYGELINRYEAKLRRYARKFLNRPEDIDDLVQDVFTKAYINLQGFDPARSFSPWIYRIAHNVFVNEIRRKDRRGGFSWLDADTILPFLAAKETTDEATLKQELSEELQALVGQLPVKYREVVTLHYYADLSYAQISETLRIPVTTVGVRMTRARAKLLALYQAANQA